MQRQVIDLDNFVLEEDGIIDFYCKPIGNITATRYWHAQRKLYFTIPA